MGIIEIVSLAQHVTSVDNKIHKHYTLGRRKTLIKTQFFVRTLLEAFTQQQNLSKGHAVMLTKTLVNLTIMFVIKHICL